MEEKKNKKQSKFKIKYLVYVLLVLVIGGLGALYYFKMPVRNIYIKGNSIASDYDIMVSSNLKDYPRLFKYSTNNIKKEISKNPIINDVKVTKYLTGKVVISVSENKFLFFDRNTNLVVLSHNVKISPDSEYEAFIPTLINFVPNDIYLDFVSDFDRIKPSIISMISEIEYKPLYSGEKIIDAKRFLLRMNDGNEVYINTVNIEQLNNYPSFYASLEDKKGVLNLDSSTKENFLFKPFAGSE